MFYLSAATLFVYFLFIVDLIVLVAKGNSLYGEMKGIIQMFVVYFLTPEALIAGFSIAFTLLANDLDPHNDNWFAHPS